MRHRKSGRKLGRNSSHRKAMFRNMVTSLFEHGSIRTTNEKAKELRGLADRMVTLGKKDTVHARRLAARTIRSGSVLHRLFDQIAPGFLERHGGYTRIIKIGRRRGDNAAMSQIELMPAGAPEPRHRVKPVAPSVKPTAAMPESKERFDVEPEVDAAPAPEETPEEVAAEAADEAPEEAAAEAADEAPEEAAAEAADEAPEEVAAEAADEAPEEVADEAATVAMPALETAELDAAPAEAPMEEPEVASEDDGAAETVILDTSADADDAGAETVLEVAAVTDQDGDEDAAETVIEAPTADAAETVIELAVDADAAAAGASDAGAETVLETPALPDDGAETRLETPALSDDGADDPKDEA